MRFIKHYAWVIISTVALILIFALSLRIYSGKNAPLSVRVYSDNSVQKISAWYDAESETYYFFLPSYANPGNTKISVGEYENLMTDGKQIKDGDDVFELFETDRKYLLKESGFLGKTHKVSFAKAENVSTMYVETSTGSMKEVFKNKNHEEPATVKVYDADGTVDTDASDVTINGRGNSTWTQEEKKPFTLKFGEKQSILGMGRCSKWILLADAKDKAHVKNKLIFDMAKKVGLAYTPDNEYTMLYLNGEFYGLFVLCQSPNSMAEVAEDKGKDLVLCKIEYRGRIKELGGMIIGDGKLPVVRILPKSMSGDEEKEFKKKLEEADRSILSNESDESELNRHIDVDSWAKRYLIDEISENYDAAIASSYFLWEKGEETGRIYAGPVWDYDNSFGGPPSVIRNPAFVYLDYKRRGPQHPRFWYPELMANEDFHNKVLDLYKNYFSDELDDLANSYVPGMIKRLEKAVNCDGIRWQHEAAEANEKILKFLSERKKFLDSYWISGDSYCKVRYLIDDTIEYRYEFVPYGKTIFDSAYVDPTLRDESYSIYEEESGKKFDLNQQIYEDINLVVHKEGLGNSEFEKKVRRFASEPELLMVPLTVLFMMLVILALFIRERIGGAGKK